MVSRQRDWQRKRYDQGLCVLCGIPAEARRDLCDAHRDLVNAGRRRRAASAKARLHDAVA